MHKNNNIFVDTKTNRPLNLIVEEESDGHVWSGRLYNENSEYPIIKGIPRFVEKSLYKSILDNSKEVQTVHSFGNKWREKIYQKLGRSKYDYNPLWERFMALLGCQTPSQLKKILKKAKKVLNAGCGIAWSEYLFNINPKTQRHCVDISLAVETAYSNTKRINNVIVSQASLFKLPYANETFDVIYSDGVIHHTPNPKKALYMIIDKLIPGGLIGIYVYCRKPLLREIIDKELRKVTTKMSYEECLEFSKSMSSLGRALNKIDKPIVIDKGIKLLQIKKGRYDLHRFIYDYFIKCWYSPKQDIRYADLVNQDWYHPYYASHHIKEEIIQWFKEGGVSKIRIIQPKGWEYSGYFVSGRKKG